MTQRRLVLVRHAKAAVGSPDFERPLSERGQRDAAAIGRWLREHGIAPDRIVVSPATRALQTLERLAAAFDPLPTHEVDSRIYDNSVRELLTIARETSPDTHTVVLVGHSPSMHQLAASLDDGSGDPAARATLADKFPTSAVAVFAVDEWAALSFGAATLLHLDAPRG
jgi:phosphohistidine phosphatase